MKIGIISDTHLPNKLFGAWDVILENLKDVDLILHAGDIQSASVLDSLENVAPVVAALGNNDLGPLEQDPRVKPTQVIEIEGWIIGIIHDLEPEDRPIEQLISNHFGTHLDIVISGHTHWEKLELRNGIIHINPGSPNLPHNYSHRLGIVGIIDIKGQHLNAELVHLGDLPDLVNPSLKGLVLNATKTDEGIRVNGLANFKPTGI